MNVSNIMPPMQKEFPPYVWFPAMLSPPECKEIIRIGESRQLEAGKIGNGINSESIEDTNYRCVQTSAITDDDAPWLYQKLRDHVIRTNVDFFRMDIHGFFEHLVFLKYTYDPEKPGKYNWHQDIGGGMSSLRKLSTVTQLSDPADYEGGRLHLFTNKDLDPEHIAMGDTIIFPSYLPHCVTPLERGVRYSLVSWVTGPQYR
jgi:PKHD-type hydroxylase